MPSIKKIVTGAACMALLSLSAAPAMAQSQGQPAGQTEAQMQSTNVSGSSLRLYAKAAQKILDIKRELQNEMQQAQTQAEAKGMQDAAQQEMIGAVESFGMTVEEYNSIAQALQSDPEMQEKLQQILQQNS